MTYYQVKASFLQKNKLSEDSFASDAFRAFTVLRPTNRNTEIGILKIS